VEVGRVGQVHFARAPQVALVVGAPHVHPHERHLAQAAGRRWRRRRGARRRRRRRARHPRLRERVFAYRLDLQRVVSAETIFFLY
jgi:hypothetical protein